MPDIDSSALSHVSYNPVAHTLSATFRDSGLMYVYQDVPEETYEELLAAPSAGAFFNAHIRDHFRFCQLGAD